MFLKTIDDVGVTDMMNQLFHIKKKLQIIFRYREGYKTILH